MTGMRLIIGLFLTAVLASGLTLTALTALGLRRRTVPEARPESRPPQGPMLAASPPLPPPPPFNPARRPGRRGAILGGLFFAGALAIVLVYGILPADPQGRDPIVALIQGPVVAETEAWGFIGSEKDAFLKNERVVALLKQRGLTLDNRRAGSIEMVNDPALISQQADYRWPGSQVARELALQNNVRPLKDETIFNSPIVFYSWSPIAAALVEAGWATPIGSSTIAYALDTQKFLEAIAARRQWHEIGVELFDGIMLFSTDPAKSNSGNQFAGLALTIFGGAAGPADPAAQAATAALFTRMGLMEHSSGKLFEQYLRQGMGAKPVIAGYESQLIEFAHANPDLWRRAAGGRIHPVVLYPTPTVFSSHVFLAMNDKGVKVMEALMTPEVQDIAWREHGYRSGFASTSDVRELAVEGIPDQVTQVVPMPPLSIIEDLIDRLQSP